MSDLKLKDDPNPEGGEAVEEDLLGEDVEGENLSEGEGGDPVEGAEGHDEAPEEEVGLRARGKKEAEGSDDLRALREEFRAFREALSSRDSQPASKAIDTAKARYEEAKALFKSEKWHDMDEADREEHRAEFVLAKQGLERAKEVERARQAAADAVGSASRVQYIASQIHQDMPNLSLEKIAAQLVLNPDLVDLALKSRKGVQERLAKLVPAKKVLKKDTGYGAPGAKPKKAAEKKAESDVDISEEDFLKL